MRFLLVTYLQKVKRKIKNALLGGPKQSDGGDEAALHITHTHTRAHTHQTTILIQTLSFFLFLFLLPLLFYNSFDERQGLLERRMCMRKTGYSRRKEIMCVRAYVLTHTCVQWAASLRSERWNNPIKLLCASLTAATSTISPAAPYRRVDGGPSSFPSEEKLYDNLAPFSPAPGSGSTSYFPSRSRVSGRRRAESGAEWV